MEHDRSCVRGSCVVCCMRLLYPDVPAAESHSWAGPSPFRVLTARYACSNPAATRTPNTSKNIYKLDVSTRLGHLNKAIPVPVVQRCKVVLTTLKCELDLSRLDLSANLDFVRDLFADKGSGLDVAKRC
eukprot:59551-Prorocentrum_minimum.AAC.4